MSAILFPVAITRMDSNEFKHSDSAPILTWSSSYSFFFSSSSAFFLYFRLTMESWSETYCVSMPRIERGERQRPMRRRDAYEHKRALMSLAHTRSLSSIHCRGLISFTTNLKKLKKVLKQNNNNAKKKFREETDRRRIDASRHKITQYWNIRKKRHLKRDTLLTQKFSEFYFSDAGRQSNERTACGGEIWILKEGLDWSRCICSRFQGTLQTGELT